MKAPDEMPIKQLFEKVFIKSESDLPKEEGRYFIHDTGRKGGSEKINVDFFRNNCTEKVYWLQYYDWYLKPIEQPAEKEPKAIYTLNCVNCEKTFYSADAFPEDQLCNECFAKKYLKHNPSPAMSPKPTNDVIGFDVLKRNSDIAFDQTIKAVKESMSPKPQEEITDTIINKKFFLEKIKSYSVQWYSDVYSGKIIKDSNFNSLAKELNDVFSQMTANRREELRPTDEDINFFAAAYGELTEGNKHGELTFAYRKGAMDMRDNKIYLTSLNQKEK